MIVGEPGERVDYSDIIWYKYEPVIGSAAENDTFTDPLNPGTPLNNPGVDPDWTSEIGYSDAVIDSLTVASDDDGAGRRFINVKTKPNSYKTARIQTTWGSDQTLWSVLNGTTGTAYYFSDAMSKHIVFDWYTGQTYSYRFYPITVTPATRPTN